MRIVAGEYSSRRIEAPKGMNTRPTLDKVREAVFSSLGGSFAGGVFLDLYAGSGANGLEALSRGFERAVFVDMSRDAVNVIRRNAESLGCAKRCRIMPMKAMKALERLAEEGAVFDAVYMDPPYQGQTNDQIMTFLAEHHMLKKGGRVIIESAKEDDFCRDYGYIKFNKDKTYGIVRISYFTAEGEKIMKACYPGTFDPITNGHMDIIRRSAEVFEELVVLIMENPRKVCTFSAEERKQMIEDCLRSEGLENVSVCIGSGLTVDYTRRLGAGIIVRGIRAVTDYEFELQQASANMMLADDIETLLLIAKPEFSFLSSSVVKEIALNHGRIDNLVPEAILTRVAEKLH